MSDGTSKLGPDYTDDIARRLTNLTLQIQELSLEQLASKTSQFTSNRRNKAGQRFKAPHRGGPDQKKTTTITIETNMTQDKTIMITNHVATAGMSPPTEEVEAEDLVVPDIPETETTINGMQEHIQTNRRQRIKSL